MAIGHRMTKSKAREIEEQIQELKVKFWRNYDVYYGCKNKQKGERITEPDPIRFEKELNRLEAELCYEQYEDNRRRNWK